MNKVKVTMGDGYINIEADGHTETNVCVAVSTIMQTAVLGLREIHNEHPDKMQFEIEHREG